MDPKDVENLIRKGLPDARVRVHSDDHSHFVAIVISESFAGKRPLARHQLVYRCLGALMGNEIHAMSIKAHTDDEWRDLEASGEA